MLGLASTTIERPTTPRGAALALATGFGSATGINPLDNFAVEVTPYWLFPRPAVTAEARFGVSVEGGRTTPAPSLQRPGTHALRQHRPEPTGIFAPACMI